MQLSIQLERWPIRGSFTISRGSKTEAEVIVVSVRDGVLEGKGECVPYRRYNETIESVLERIESVRSALEKGISRKELDSLLPAGAARNAVECALWDLEAKKAKKTIWQLVGTPNPVPVQTTFTLSLDTPEAMAAKAAEKSQYHSLLKVKLGGEGDEERLRKIRDVAPKTRLIIDANEGWNAGNLKKMVRMCEEVGIELVEQPLPAGDDAALSDLKTLVKICADESVHTSADIPKLVGRYDAVNIKLDKAGGLTEALAMAKAAKEAKLSIMVGCMVSTSLSMAPATVLAQYADYADLDGPLLLAQDRRPGIGYRDGAILPTVPALWG